MVGADDMSHAEFFGAGIDSGPTERDRARAAIDQAPGGPPDPDDPGTMEAERRHNPDHWVTARGVRVEPSRMNDGHLRNTLAMLDGWAARVLSPRDRDLQKRADEWLPATYAVYPKLVAEAERRGIEWRVGL